MATQPAAGKGENATPLTTRRLHLAPRTLAARRDARGLRVPGWSRGACRAEVGGAGKAPACGEASAGRPDRQNLLASLFPLVKRMALKMCSHLPASVEVDDLVGAGALGLLDAVDKFDSTKRAKLETYARHRIRGSMLDSLRALDPASRSVRKESRKIEKLYRDLGNRLGRAVEDEEMAEALGVDLQEWYTILEKLQATAKDGDLGRRARCPARAWAGADGPEAIGADPASGGATYRPVQGGATYRPVHGGAGPFEWVLRREQREILDRALAGLPERDRAVVTLYYQRELTMGQIAARLGVDESRISQIHSQAVARLRIHVQARLRPSQPVHGIDSSYHLAINSLPAQPHATFLQ